MKSYGYMSESQLQEAVAEYLVRQYPDVMFHSDFGSGVKLTPAQAIRQRRQNGGRSKWPDLEIAQPRRWNRTHDLPTYAKNYDRSDWLYKGISESGLVYESCGLYIELKKEDTRLKKKNGDWATEHIAEQAEVLEKLRRQGYCAEFAVGFDEAKKIIDEYLGGNHEKTKSIARCTN